MKKAFLCILLFPLALYAGEITLTDSLNRKVVFESLPQRIIITGKADYTLVNALYLFPEGKERLVAMNSTVHFHGNFPEKIDANFKQKQVLNRPDAEKLASYRPDVVLMKDFSRNKLGRSLEAAGIKVVYLSMETPESWFRDLRTLARLLGNSERGEDIISFMEERIQKAELPDSHDKKKTLFLYYSLKGGHVSFKIPSDQWIQTEMVKKAGGEPVWSEAVYGSGWTLVSLETIAAWDPEAIFVTSYYEDVNAVVSSLYEDPLWKGLKSVESGSLFAMAHDFFAWDLPDVRWVLGLEYMQSRLNNEEYSRESVYEYFSFMYNISLDDFQRDFAPLIFNH